MKKEERGIFKMKNNEIIQNQEAVNVEILNNSALTLEQLEETLNRLKGKNVKAYISTPNNAVTVVKEFEEFDFYIGKRRNEISCKDICDCDYELFITTKYIDSIYAEPNCMFEDSLQDYYIKFKDGTAISIVDMSTYLILESEKKKTI